MDWTKELNASIQYIEDHILEDIDYQQLGEIAGCSAYHYQRMFMYLAGMPVSEYVRKRRMSLAATDLLKGDKVIDVALKYGYNSPTAFNRAFQSIHGIAPSSVKSDEFPIKSFPPLTFQITIRGIDELTYKVEEKESFRVVGISIPISNNISDTMQKIPLVWKEMIENQTIISLEKHMNASYQGIFGISHCIEENNYKYYIAVNSEDDCDYEELVIPKAMWAIFTNQGTGISIQDLQSRIFLEWLPTSGYEYVNLPDIEIYRDPNPLDTKYEVWVPIKLAQGGQL